MKVLLFGGTRQGQAMIVVQSWRTRHELSNST